MPERYADTAFEELIYLHYFYFCCTKGRERDGEVETVQDRNRRIVPLTQLQLFASICTRTS